MIQYPILILKDYKQCFLQCLCGKDWFFFTGTKAGQILGLLKFEVRAHKEQNQNRIKIHIEGFLKTFYY